VDLLNFALSIWFACLIFTHPPTFATVIGVVLIGSIWIISITVLNDVGLSNASMSDPILAYCAESEINQLQWSSGQFDWIAIAFGSKMQILRV